MKLGAVGSLLGVSALTLGSAGRADDLSLSLSGWRARPGTPLPVVLEVLGADGAGLSGVGRLSARLVVLDDEGGVEAALSEVALVATGSTRWEATVQAPPGLDPRREAYKLAVAFVDAQGKLALSAPVEIICTPFHAGY